MIVVGHRGARFVVPENTLRAFEFALKHGADAVECDVWKTRDGVLIVHHDRDIKVGNKRLSIRALTFPEIRRLRPLIPTLKEVINLVVENYEKELFIEIKDVHASNKLNLLLSNVSDEVKRKIIIISFYAPFLNNIKHSRKGLIFVVRPLSLSQLVEGLDLEWIVPRKDMVDEELVKEAHELGLKVFSWLHNTQSEVKEAVELGVDAIGTDRPDLVSKWIKRFLVN